MDAQQARNFLYGVTDLECLQEMPELIEGIKEAAALIESQDRAIRNMQWKEKRSKMSESQWKQEMYGSWID